MQPVQITIRDLPTSPALEDHIRRKADKLSQFYQRINSCRIVITVPQKHKHTGKLYCVRIDLTVPGKELVVNKQLDQDVYVAIRDAFRALCRQLEEYARKRRGNVKSHELASRGYISRIFHEDGYGFIQGADGLELYFSPMNLAHAADFSQLKAGDVVGFLPQPANEGWQAHRVTVDKGSPLAMELE